jgi:hypothetical protein
MITVASHEIAHVALAPLIEVLRVSVGHFGNTPHIEGFVHHHEPHAIAQVQQFGRGRIVAGANRIHAGAAQNFELPLGGSAVHGCSQRAQVVVIANAL